MDKKHPEIPCYNISKSMHATHQMNAIVIYDYAVGITIEPAGGSPGPTGIKVLGGENF